VTISGGGNTDKARPLGVVTTNPSSMKVSMWTFFSFFGGIGGRGCTVKDMKGVKNLQGGKLASGNRECGIGTHTCNCQVKKCARLNSESEPETKRVDAC
jgi:hypothetical protein